MSVDALANLNEAQREAAQTVEGPLLILAGPGSGKTRVIVHRIAHLILDRAVRPHSIIAMTFTNKAAREMRGRLDALLTGRDRGLTMGTFHGVCASFLRRDGQHIGVDQNFVIYDAADQLSRVRHAMEELDISPDRFAPKVLHQAIGAAKSQLLGVEEHAEMNHESYLDEIVHRVYDRYEALLTRSNALDFQDLLFKTVRLFETVPDVLAKYQERFAHLLVDEYQDTNKVQYLLARQLAGKHRNICVVGDPDQSIYSWRDADIRNILDFEKDYPGAKVVFLERNYRSTKIILEAAHSLISRNNDRKDVRVWTENASGAPIVLHEAIDAPEEAQFVVSEVERITQFLSTLADQKKEDVKFSIGDIAVMYRTNAQSRAVEDAFLRHDIPYRLVGALRFYQRREVKDIVSYLRLISNPNDDVSLSRIINVPRRGIGKGAVEELSRVAKDLGGASLYGALQHIKEETQVGARGGSRMLQPLVIFLDLLDSMVEASKTNDIVSLLDLVLELTKYKTWLLGRDDGEERLENLLELRTVASEHDEVSSREGLASFLERIALVSDVDNLDEQSSATTLITLHQAKGLEFPVVFIIGMEEGLLPHSRSIDDPSQMEEERRLFYVGVTRAKERLYLLRAFGRNLMGSSVHLPISRFLSDIPAKLYSGHEQVGQPSTVKRKSSARRPSSNSQLFNDGDHVQHDKFGRGIVIDCKDVGDDQEVTVVFKGETGIKKLLGGFAHLVKVS